MSDEEQDADLPPFTPPAFTAEVRIYLMEQQVRSLQRRIDQMETRWDARLDALEDRVVHHLEQQEAEWKARTKRQNVLGWSLTTSFILMLLTMVGTLLMALAR